jgi:hypothetical protein
MAAPKAPAGAKSDKLWRDALMRALHRPDKGHKLGRLERLAEKCVKMALGGDGSLMREIADRLDGRSTQTVNYRHISNFEDLSDTELENLARGVAPAAKAKAPKSKGSAAVH